MNVLLNPTDNVRLYVPTAEDHEEAHRMLNTPNLTGIRELADAYEQQCNDGSLSGEACDVVRLLVVELRHEIELVECGE